MTEKQSLVQAVGAFLAPLMAEYARLIDEGNPETPLFILIGGEGGYTYETTLRDLQALDNAYLEAMERNDKAACARRNRKAVGAML